MLGALWSCTRSTNGWPGEPVRLEPGPVLSRCTVEAPCRSIDSASHLLRRLLSGGTAHLHLLLFRNGHSRHLELDHPPQVEGEQGAL